RLGLGRPTGAEAAAGVASLAVVVIALVWLRNPWSAALLVPAAHLWLLAAAPEVRIGRLVAVALALGGFALPALAAVGYAVALHAGPIDLLWICLLAVAVARCRTTPPRRTIEPPDVVSRGPLSYAGPGSLGGTESALRR